MSKLAAYYDGKVIFTTGLTGSMGIVWAHKILTCTNVKRVYGLVRAPPGEEQKRLHETWRTFVPLSAQRMIDDGRVIAINGDITRGPLLGMDEAMAQRLREEAHIVMSIGAEINLGKKAKDLAATNIFGGLAVAALAASCPKLERFIFASTIYSQSHLGDFDEEIYPIPGSDPEDELKALMSTGPAFSLDPWHFGYAYTKNLVERLLVQRFPQLPTCIIRPSVVGPALAEPEPLWLYLSSMPLFCFLSLATQQAKTRPMEHFSEADFLQNFFDEIPVDYVVSCLIAHTAAGTLGPVHANSASQPYTTQDIFGSNLDLLPPQVWRKDITFQQMRGLAGLYKIVAAVHARGSDKKTRALVRQMSREDLALFPIGLDQIDLSVWHQQKAALFRRTVSEVQGLVSGRIPAKL